MNVQDYIDNVAKDTYSFLQEHRELFFTDYDNVNEKHCFSVRYFISELYEYDDDKRETVNIVRQYHARNSDTLCVADFKVDDAQLIEVCVTSDDNERDAYLREAIRAYL